MIVGVPRETFPGERRVALVPSAVQLLRREGLEVTVEEGAGASAGLSDHAYQQSDTRLEPDRPEVFRAADIILQVRGLGANRVAGRADLPLMHPDQIVIGFLEPLTSLEEVNDLARAGVTAFAIDLMPRIARAQSMDALSSMATLSGYKAALLAAEALPRIFPMLMTAAGTLVPARVLIVGVGVAGLQAIATARRLGAVVSAYDIRPAVKEQVESLGARFVDMSLDTAEAEAEGGYARAMDEEFYRQQRELMARVVSESDAVITTAAVPGKKAPSLVSSEMVKGMRPGSVIVDLAAEGGGNCELTRPGDTVVEYGVTIMGPLNLPSTIPQDASQMYARNMVNFLLHMVKDGSIQLDTEEEIIKETLVTKGGEVVHPTVRELLEGSAVTGESERRGA